MILAPSQAGALERWSPRFPLPAGWCPVHCGRASVRHPRAAARPSALWTSSALCPHRDQGFSAQDGLGHRVGGGQDRMGGTRWAQKDRWLPSGLSEVERPSQLSVNSQGPRQDNLHLRRVQMYLQHQRECFCEFPYVRIICDLVRSFVTLV